MDSSWRYLKSKTNVPNDQRDTFVVSINREDTNELASISFEGGLGKQFWEVSIGLDGVPRAYTNGIAVDVHHTSSRNGK